jgi:hypothetical protein
MSFLSHSFFMKASSSATDLKIFAWFGVVAVILIILVPVYLGYITFMSIRTTPNAMTPGSSADKQVPSTYNEPLGEAGSHCGGPSHLPCRPGLKCSNDPMKVESLGVCQAASATTTSASGYVQLGGVCASEGSEGFCATGLFCHGVDELSTCEKMDATAPHVASLKFDGLQPVGGGYQGTAGTDVTIRVQAVNADTAIAWILRPDGPVTDGAITNDLGELKKDSGGQFQLPMFALDQAHVGRLAVKVVAKNGDSSVLVVGVAIVQ